MPSLQAVKEMKDPVRKVGDPTRQPCTFVFLKHFQYNNPSAAGQAALFEFDRYSSVRRKHIPLEVHELSAMVDSMDGFIHVVIHEQLRNIRIAWNFRYQSESQMYYKHRTALS